MKSYLIEKLRTGIPVLAACLTFSGFQVVGAEKLDDNSIAFAIEDEYMFDETVPLSDVDMRVKDGIVYLDGIVPNLLARNRAIRIAETVKGVRSVINNLEVQRVDGLSANELRRDVEIAFSLDPVVERYEITVETEDMGLVSLKGYVDSWQEKEFATAVASSVRGVTAVTNNIEVVPHPTRPDDEIAVEVRKRLEWDALVDHSLIGVDVDRGTVKLSGVVGSLAEKSQARMDAWITGTRNVDAADLEVQSWARDEDLRGDKYVHRTDDEINQAILDAYSFDPRVFSYDVTPYVTDGWVTLRGKVDNLRAKAAAVNIANHTVGVTGVTDRIKIRLDTPTADEALENSIKTKLDHDPLLFTNDVHFSVTDGVARLSGVVDSQFDKARTEVIINGIAGIKSVKNFLRVADTESVVVYDPYIWDHNLFPWNDFPVNHSYEADIYGSNITDKQIAKDIAEKLYWSPFVDHEEITVLVEDGVATLVGEVQSKKEKRMAAEKAILAGAKEVQNNLIIES
ncbi:MAG: BON domain-containing protein [Verrucomicrobiae bacterium]|nr:BON domain-containing protein [Verrucomicrobiae bacterium]